MLDSATGGTLDVTGAARLTPGGGFAFTDLLASGQHGTARLNGEYGRDKVDLGARIDIPQTQVLDPRVTGKAEIAGALSGTPSDLTAALKANLGEGRLLDRKTSGIALEALANHVTGLIDANATLSGDVDGHPLQGSAHVARHDDGGWAIDNLALSLASARLAGALAVGADALATGDLSFSATNLDDLSPLVLTKLTGALRGESERLRRRGQASALGHREQRPDDHRREQTRRPQSRLQDSPTSGARKSSPGSRSLRGPKSAGSRSPASS